MWNIAFQQYNFSILFFCVGTIVSCEANGKIQKIENIDNLAVSRWEIF
jgi:hypothetical protein